VTFADLVAGESVFLDANAFVYHFALDPAYGTACSQLLQRIENQDLLGLTSTHDLTEVAHRLMTIEAIATYGWPVAGVAQRLRRHPAEVQRLTAFRRAVDSILHSRVQVLAIAPALLGTATVVSQGTGLLSNDALIVAVMQANGLTHLASNDADFDRVPGLTRYTPA
jgi:predicted nucleic acid-binding protein